MTSTIEVQSPRGRPVLLHHREGTTDLSTIGSIFRLWGTLHDEYSFGAMHPRTFLDIGGHIGTATVSVLVDNPDARAVIVEPLPENIGVIEANLAENGLTERAVVVQAAIGSEKTQRIGYTLARVSNAGANHRYVGSPVDDDYTGEAMTSPTVPLSALLDQLSKDRIDLAKIDCEGCEWVALRQPCANRVDRWVGEYHGRPGAGDIAAMLSDYHVTIAPHDHGATGLFTADRL